TIFCLAMAGVNHFLEVKKVKEWQDKNSVTLSLQVNKKDEIYAAEILQLVVKRLEKMKMTNVTTSVAGNVITITVGGVTEKERLQNFVSSRANCVIGALNNDDIAVLIGVNGTEFINTKRKANIPYNDIFKYSKVVVPAKNLSFTASINKTKSGYEIPVSVTPRTKSSQFSRYIAEHQGDYLLYFVDDKLLSTQEITPTTIQAMIPMPRSDGIKTQEEYRVRTVIQAIQLLYPYPADVTLQSTTNK
ncbi:MAG: hypothetical protein WCO98_15225, partial [bacterium]